jgi:hypothetical protein
VYTSLYNSLFSISFLPFINGPSVFNVLFLSRPRRKRTGSNLSSNQFPPFWFISPFGVAATVKIDLRTVLALPGYSNVQCSNWACYTFLSGEDKHDQTFDVILTVHRR